MALFGAMMFPTDYAIQPVELARAVEERGLDSLFFPEHTHIPTSRRSPWPGGGELPMEYSHTHDLFVALGAAAAVPRESSSAPESAWWSSVIQSCWRRKWPRSM